MLAIRSCLEVWSQHSRLNYPIRLRQTQHCWVTTALELYYRCHFSTSAGALGQERVW